MKKKLLIFILPIIALIAILGIIIFAASQSRTFYLEDSYYNQKGFKEINATELNDLIDTQESFVLFIYQPTCVTSADFEEILTKFNAERPILIYKIAFSKLKDTVIGERIPYYPSFAVFRKGKMVDFLKSDQDEDSNKFTNLDDFTKWFDSYVKVKETDHSQIIEIGNSEDENGNSSTTANLSHITKTDGKVNIYFFWGNGCPHCAEENKFFQEIEREYGKYYNIYRFETWYNDDNATLMKTFATAMGDETKGVPYTIIGDQSFIGFPEEYREKMKNAIKQSANSDFDIYFDKIKPELDNQTK